ncbi:protein unc-45 homolog A [Corythoichthys intestinalis]|uniref:protein unc-45 homolog A n=1 Tax=Corythoichthys intestinalis TaxID=161448 RepID=UPI0025A553B1|nr:protein unc-45 homolog A [Corythoichthys intestinalis]XP_061813012.1 protein unc-45 homolog A-like [Nerophis lumbriciformis]
MSETEEEKSSAALREKGNNLFKAGDMQGAVCCYTRALKLSDNRQESAVLYRNRSACYLKLEDYNKAETDASKSLETDPGDVKARFRRAQAFQKLGRFDQAFVDAQKCAQLEPKNKAFQDLLRQLGAQIHQKSLQLNSTDARVQQMFSLLVDPAVKDSDRLKAAQNLVVLSREDAGAEQIFRNDGVRLIHQLLQSKQEDVVLSALRTLVGLCTDHQSRTMAIVNELGMEQLCKIMGSGGPSVSLATCHLLQVMFEALTEGMKREVRGKEEAILLEPSKELRSMFHHLLEMMPASNVSGPGRDNAINLLVKQVPRKSLKVPDNSLTLWVIDQGLKKILEVAASVPELSEGPALTENSHMSCAVLLNKLYDDLQSDKERENFNKLCEDYVRQHFNQTGLNGKLRAIQTVSVLLQGPSDVGNQTLEMSGMMDAVISLCASEDVIHQQVAVEALIHAAGKAKRASFITANGVTLLKDLYKKSENDRIRVRALVGLCKLGSAGGTDFSMKQFAEGSTLKLSKQCRKWLCNESLPPTSRRWSVEGLAYLTFDADVKEDLVEDKTALHAMFELAKSEDKTVLFAVGSTLVNCTNSYEVEKPDPQMVELAKYAKQHVPEEHPKDAASYVEKRLMKLLEAGVVSALVCMVKHESPALTDACRECIARVFLALVERQEDRGRVVAQGGGKALIPLASENTDVGKVKAAQALSKITITSNPEIAFPGERMYEVVRPLVSLLNLDCTMLQNFEALMALTNLAGISERLRQKIIKEKAVPKIEGYMFEEHDLVRAAATECICNLILSTEVQKLFLATGNDRLKLLVLYCGEEDERLRKAAAGSLAMLTADQPELCARITTTTTHWLEILQALLLSEISDLRHRGAVIIFNMMQAEKSLAETLIESEVLEILSVLAKGGQSTPEPASKVAQNCLEKAMEYGIIMSREGKEEPGRN